MDISKEYIKMCDCEEVQKQKHEDLIMQPDIIDKIKFEDWKTGDELRELMRGVRNAG